MYTAKTTTPPTMGSHASQRSFERLGRNRKEGKRPQMNPPTWDRFEVPGGPVATVTTKNIRKATIITERRIGLHKNCQGKRYHCVRIEVGKGC